MRENTSENLRVIKHELKSGVLICVRESAETVEKGRTGHLVTRSFNKHDHSADWKWKVGLQKKT